MFEGKSQELVTDKMDASSRTFKERMMYVETVLKKKFMELYGRDYAKTLRSHTQASYTLTRGDGTTTMLSQNQMYYWYNQYKDPANQGSFENMFGSNYKEIMSDLEANLEPKVKEFADWQVNEFFPELYDNYNEVYKRLYLSLIHI